MRKKIRIGKTTRKNSGNSIVPDMSKTANAMRKIPKALTLNISKDDKKLGQVRYSDQKHASIAGADGKTADYSVFLGLVKDAKRNNQAINFSGEMSPEFAAKLKLACEELGVAYQNAPEGKIDANGFEDQLSEESKRKLAEYNAKFDRQKENTQEQPAGPKNYDESS